MEDDPSEDIPPPAPKAASGQSLPSESEWRNLSVIPAQPAEFLGQHLQASLTGLLADKGQLTFDAVAIAFLNANYSVHEAAHAQAMQGWEAERKRSEILHERIVNAERDAAVAKAALGAIQTANEVKNIASTLGGAILALAPWLVDKVGWLGGTISVVVGVILIGLAFMGKVRTP